MMPSEPNRQLITGHPRCGKTTALADAAADLVAAGAEPAHMLALSVHRRAVQALREALGERAGRDVPTADVRRFATSLLERFPEFAGLPAGWTSSDIISAPDRQMLMRRAWAQAARGTGALYRQYGTQPGALDWLARVFDAFAEWCGTAEPGRLLAVQPPDQALAELWAAYHEYLRLSAEYGLVAFQEVVPRALDALRRGPVRATVAPAVLLLDDLDQFRPSELLLARALIEPTTTVIAVAARAGAGSDDPGTRYLNRWLRELGLRGEIEDTPVEGPGADTIHFAAYPTPRHEVDAIARHIATTLPAGGRLADYAVVVFDPELAPLLRRTLPRWGIAVEGMEARSAYTLALAPLLRTGMRLLAGAPVADEDLLDMLRHPALGLPPADARLCAAAITDNAPARADDPFPEWLWPAHLSQRGRSRLRELFSVTRAIRKTDRDPSVKLRRWIDKLGLRDQAAACSSAALEPWAVAADEELLDRWLTFLRRTEQIRRRLREPLSDAEAVEVLETSQALVEPMSRQLHDAVQVWSPEQLGGCGARTVWLAGLVEQVLPQPAASLPWSAPEAFASSFAALPGFVPPERDDRASRWERAMTTLRGAASRAGEQLVISWSAAARDGKRRLPSPVLNTLRAELAAAGKQPEPMPIEEAVASSRTPADFELPMLQPALPRSVAAGEVAVRGRFSASASAIEDFLACPRRHFYARVLNLYDVVSSPRQALGQVVHAALRDLKQAGDAAPEVAALVEQHWPRGGQRFGTAVREAAYRRMAEHAVGEVAALDAEAAAAQQFVAAEATFQWQITPELELRGAIDRVDRGPDGLIVLDYKLGKESPSINGLLGKFVPPLGEDAGAAWRPSDLQLPLYALAVEHGALQDQATDGERVAEVGLVFPLQLRTKTGKLADAGRRMIRIVEHVEGCAACGARPERSPKVGLVCREQLDAIRARAVAAIEEMRAGNIEPDPRDGADTCRACAFRAICPAPRG
ncbi:MAG TPA: PD-(D/E)XK nuclease family protein [Herpetosiphonaceae bacterium]|nr:PD-(D/E)XK nuclease family protein [Herpetosiphonaceae bacterium]